MTNNNNNNNKRKRNDDDHDDWIKAAMEDDGIVAELLFQIKREATAAAALRLVKANVEQYSAPPIDRRVRQRGSQLNLTPPSLPPRPPPRSSPNTELTLSCGGGVTASTSASGGGGARFEESNGGKEIDASRSNKLGVRGGAFVSKKPKKKTLEELKALENLLLKERTHLLKELAVVRFNLEEQEATNEILRRQSMETRVNFAPANDSTENNIASNESNELANDSTENNIASNESNELVSSMAVTVSHTPHPEENVLSLPDLNIPLEDA